MPDAPLLRPVPASLVYLVKNRPATGPVAARLAACALAAGCALPTDAPSWETRWSIPAASTDISVRSLLPEGMSVSADSAAFLVAVDPVVLSRTISDDCRACAVLNGQTIAKPDFVLRATGGATLPADVEAARLVAGSAIDVTIENQLGFDPLRVAGAASEGRLIVVVRSGADVVAADTVRSADTPLPAGAVLRRTLPVRQVTVGRDLAVEAVIESPAGEPVRIDAGRALVVRASASTLRFGDARVRIASRAVQTTALEIDLSGVPDAVRDRVEGGELVLDVDDPMAVRGTLLLELAGDGARIEKSVVLDGSGVRRVAFTRDELATLFGHRVVLTGRGPVSTAAPVTVTPRSAVRVRARFDFTLRTESR